MRQPQTYPGVRVGSQPYREKISVRACVRCGREQEIDPRRYVDRDYYCKDCRRWEKLDAKLRAAG